MDSGVRRLVVDVTDESDDGIVAYAFLQREFAFVGIADEVLGIDMLYPSGPFVVCRVHCLREFIDQFFYLSKRELRLVAAAHGELCFEQARCYNNIDRVLSRTT